jgi:hypothetical protein
MDDSTRVRVNLPGNDGVHLLVVQGDPVVAAIRFQGEAMEQVIGHAGAP